MIVLFRSVVYRCRPYIHGRSLHLDIHVAAVDAASPRRIVLGKRFHLDSRRGIVGARRRMPGKLSLEGAAVAAKIEAEAVGVRPQAGVLQRLLQDTGVPLQRIQRVLPICRDMDSHVAVLAELGKGPWRGSVWPDG